MESLSKFLKAVGLFSVTLLVAFNCYGKVTFSQKTIVLGNKTLVVDVAATPDQHAYGLMYKNKLGKNQGMLFIFNETQRRAFWMKNTLIDLSIGYFDRDGVLFQILEMKSGKGVQDKDLPNYPSSAPAKYALEMNKNWFQENKINPGMKLNIK